MHSISVSDAWKELLDKYDILREIETKGFIKFLLHR